MKSHHTQKVTDDFIFLEGAKWSEGRLWASDVFDHKVYSIAPDGRRGLVCEVPNRPSGLGFLPDGTLIIVSALDKKLLQLDGDKTSVYADLSDLAPGAVNDFAVDGRGRLYVGDFGYDYDHGEAPRPTMLYRVDTDGKASVVADNVEFPNGSVVINEDRTLIVAETWVGRLTAFDLSVDGKLTNRRIFANLGERQPDGICADAEGAIWTACFNTGEFLRVLDGGEITHRIAIDGRGITCALGGESGHELFLSTYLGPVSDLVAGLRKCALFKTEVDVPALSPVKPAWRA